jgi:hypothetical protein
LTLEYIDNCCYWDCISGLSTENVLDPVTAKEQQRKIAASCDNDI